MLITGRKSNRRGAVLVKVLLCLPVLIGMLALNLDGGRVTEERRRARTAADAAALAAAAKLYDGYWDHQGKDPNGTARAAALASAQSNGYPRESVTVNIPPLSGPFAGQDGHVEVAIDNPLDTTFGAIFTREPMQVGARAVARGEPMKIGIICLREDGNQAFRNDSLLLTVLNKPIVVNSNASSAFVHAGLGVLIATHIDVTGNVSIGGLLNVSRVWTGMQPTLDPLAFLPVPEPGPIRSNSPLTINSILPVILTPGTYRGGIRVTGTSIVLMLPGVYTMEGGGFRVDQLATVTGLGTMVYNTTSPTYAPGPISISGLGKVVMTAPLFGTYQGLNFFQNRSMTQPFSLTGLGLTTLTGTVYAASAPALVTGTVAAAVDILGGAYVVESMTTTGVGAVTLNLNLNPPRVPDVRLVE